MWGWLPQDHRLIHRSKVEQWDNLLNITNQYKVFYTIAWQFSVLLICSNCDTGGPSMYGWHLLLWWELFLFFILCKLWTRRDKLYLSGTYATNFPQLKSSHVVLGNWKQSGETPLALINRSLTNLHLHCGVEGRGSFSDGQCGWEFPETLRDMTYACKIDHIWTDVCASAGKQSYAGTFPTSSNCCCELGAQQIDQI